MKFLFKILQWIYSTIFHLSCITAIYYLLLPIFNWYLSKKPILGVDFFNSVTYVTYLTHNFSFQFNGFKDIWFAGYPLSRDFISLSYYPMILFAKSFDVIRGIQLYVLFSLFLLGLFSYLLFYQVSKSRLFSLLITLFVLYSSNIYGAAIWGGSLPYFTSQFFFPFTLLLVLKYVQTANSKWLMGSMIAAGLGFLGHPLLMFGFTMPSGAVLIFFGPGRKAKSLFGKILDRAGRVFIFGFGTILVAFPITFDRVFHIIVAFLASPQSLLGIANTGSSIPLVGEAATSTGASDIANFYRGLPKLLFTDTNIWLFIFAGIGVLLFVFTVLVRFNKQPILRVLPFLFIALYLGLHPLLNAYGFSLIPQGWYRAFWAFPVAIGMLSSALWGEFFMYIREKFRLDKIVFHIMVSNLPFAVFGMIFVLIGILFISSKPTSFLEILDTKSETSSAHPQALGIRISPEEQNELKEQLIPDFIDSEDKNKRLYEADALVNIWWNYMYKMPLARGYIDPPIATSERGGFFWLDISIANDSIVRDFKISEKVALQNALFLIDWYGIYYFEGGRLGISTSPGPSSYLLENKQSLQSSPALREERDAGLKQSLQSSTPSAGLNIFEKNEKTTVYGAILKWQTASGKPELHREVPQYLNFYKIKDEFTSPVLYPTNAKVIAVFSDLSAYEDLMRALGFSNLNSQYIIPVSAGPYIDDFTSSDFSRFDAVILNNYKYHSKNRAFKLLGDFAKAGGKIFIDTGNETKESESDKLPEIFPMDSSKRKGLGREWQIQASSDVLTGDINFGEFGPLVFNDDEWRISYPKGNVRDGSKVLLSHQEHPVIIRRPIGRGEVIWSGVNLLYHMTQYRSDEEYKFFTNILNEFAKVEKSQVVPADAKWISSEKVQISSTSPARGVLFKEEGYDRWKANLISDGGKRLPVYKVGPTYPGFMYVPLPKKESFTLEFNYGGTVRSYLLYIVQGVFVLFLLERIILNGIITNKFKIFSHHSKGKIGEWWEKEDEG